jgi:tetratricopeptide (TPR) repeat protein
MTTPEPPRPRRLAHPGWTAAAALLIAAAALLAYRNTFGVPFVYDDLTAIPGNASIRHLWPPSPGPVETTVGGRPLANYSLALNYALSGTAVGTYHALNLAIHVLAALALFGLVRRTLARGAAGRPATADALPLALGAALLWAVHPLATESVTYVVQRVESLMGLLYLLTLYCFARSVDSARPRAWRGAAFAACLLGMATKEVMATAPVMVLLYDRTFAAGSFREAWRRRNGFYLALASTWILLAALVFATGGNRAGSAGFNVGVSPPDYWLTQFEAVTRYLGLGVWPHPLVFEYGPFRAHGLLAAAPYALVVLALAAVTAYALVRRPAFGFLGAWVFVILAPSSLVPVATQTMAEHRMYLPLAALTTALVLGVHRASRRGGWAVLAVVAVALGYLTFQRNRVYASDLSLWTDTVARRPGNANARNNLGLALFHAGDGPGAVREYRAALALEPRYPGVLNNLGNALEAAGDRPQAIGAYERALALEPDYPAAHFNLAKALDDAGRAPEAIPHFEAVLRSSPNAADAHRGLADALAHAGRADDAAGQYGEALRLDPRDAAAEFGLGNLLAQSGRPAEAEAHYEAALRIDPTLAAASNNLGLLLCRAGRVAEGLPRIEAAIRLQPGFATAHFTRGMALLQLGRRDEAVGEFETVLRLRPNDPRATRMLRVVGAAP